MISLIRNELSKIFHKKAVYIIFVIMTAMIALSAYFTYKYNQESSNKQMMSAQLGYLQEYIKTLDPNNTNQVNEYIELQTEIDLINLSQQYSADSWQYNIAYSELYDYAYNINTFKYGPDKDAQKLKNAENEYNKMLEKLNNDDWKFFANEKLKIAQEDLKELENQKQAIKDTSALKEIESKIKEAQITVDILNLRLSKDISYAESYKNTAIEDYQEARMALVNYDESMDYPYEEKQEFNKMIEQEAESKYIIETGNDIKADDTLSSSLQTMYSYNGYIIFVVLIGIIIAGTIISEEFNKGTIKLLLVRPYTRTKILFAKYITTMIMIILTMLALLVVQFVIGGIAFGFDTLNIPAVQYNFDTGSIQETGVFAYMFLRALTILPSLILITTLAFAINVLTNNAPLSIGLPIIGYMNYQLINELIEMAVASNKFEFVKYFVTEHWDLSQYLYGGLPAVEGFTMGTSIAICAAYLIIMLIPTFIFFKKENIKNV